MYKIIWTPNAEENFYSTLKYWTEHNKSSSYSLKITKEVNKVIQEIKRNPYFLSKYFEDIRLYRKSFFKARFYLYYDIIDE